MITNQIVPISHLHAHPDNFRNHPAEQIQQLAASYHRFGQFRSIVAQQLSTGEYLLVAGHGIVEAMRREGVQEVRVDVLDPSLSAEEVKGILIADNLLPQGASDDNAILAELLQEQVNAGFDLEALGSDEETLRQMVESLGDEYVGTGETGDGEDEAIPDDVPTRSHVGDIWQLGRHRIACINSCDANSVRQFIGQEPIHFVFADPPYGIDIVATNESVGGGEAYDIPFGGVKMRKGDVGGGASHMRKTGKPYLAERVSGLRGSDRASKPFGSKDVRGSDRASNVVEAGKYFPVIGDDSTQTALTCYRLCADSFPQSVHIWWGANYYANALPPSSCWIVWDKENTGNFADAELAWCSDTSAVRIFKHMWNGMLKDSEHGQRRVHPTQKPIALAVWCFEKYGKEQDVIFDPFLGSGISVIAAERMNGNRKVYGCELSPEYIDVVMSRFTALTGIKPVLLERLEVSNV